MKMLSSTAAVATMIGFCGLLIWSMSGVVAANIRNIPTFEILGITYHDQFFAHTALYLQNQRLG